MLPLPLNTGIFLGVSCEWRVRLGSMFGALSLNSFAENFYNFLYVLG